MNHTYSTGCTLNKLVLKVMTSILLRSTAVPRMVTSSTGVSVAIIGTNLNWPRNQLKPSRSLTPWHVVVIEQDLILNNIIKFLQRPLLI